MTRLRRALLTILAAALLVGVPAAALGQTGSAPANPRLGTLLVTGDSMSEPLDSDLARALTPDGVRVIQDPHIGTGISTTFIIDWRQLAVTQVKHDHPNAVVVFIGANDGFPMTGPHGHQVSCCGPAWEAIYAGRVRQIANTYRQNGTAKVYWLTLPAPQEAARQKIARVVNAAIRDGVKPWPAQIRVIDTVPIFTPGGVYRASMPINGVPTVVRQPDGIHLNAAGSSLLATIVQAAIGRDFSF